MKLYLSSYKFGNDTQYLKEISSNDNYLYIGYSAGSCILSKDLEPLAIVDEPKCFYNESKVI